MNLEPLQDLNRLLDRRLEHVVSTLLEHGRDMKGSMIVLLCFMGRSIFVGRSCRLELNILFLDVFEKPNPLSYVWERFDNFDTVSP